MYKIYCKANNANEADPPSLRSVGQLICGVRLIMKEIKNRLSDILLALLLVSGFIVYFVVPELLIFVFETEAREDWTRMLPVALFGPFLWGMAIFSLIAGFWFLWQSIRERELHMLPFSFALIHLGIRVPFYWIKRIVIDNVPAFGTTQTISMPLQVSTQWESESFGR